MVCSQFYGIRFRLENKTYPSQIASPVEHQKRLSLHHDPYHDIPVTKAQSLHMFHIDVAYQSTNVDSRILSTKPVSGSFLGGLTTAQIYATRFH